MNPGFNYEIKLTELVSSTYRASSSCIISLTTTGFNELLIFTTGLYLIELSRCGCFRFKKASQRCQHSSMPFLKRDKQISKESKRPIAKMQQAGTGGFERKF